MCRRQASDRCEIVAPCERDGPPSRLWLWIVAAFALQGAVWTAWLIFAAHHKIEEVPLATDSRALTAPQQSSRSGAH